MSLIERDLRFFSSSALAELTPTQLEEWAGASRQAVAQLEAMQAEIERLREALLAIEEGRYVQPLGKRYRDDGTPSKHDQCVHGMFFYEACGQCIDAHVRASLDNSKEGEK